MERHAAYFLKITSSMLYKNFCFQNVKEEKDHAEDTSLKVVKYARTPVMSTYLVAFVVGEFDFVEGRDANGVTIRVYTPKGREVRGQFALEVSLAKCITNFSQFTLISTITLLILSAIVISCNVASEILLLSQRIIPLCTGIS